MTPRRSNPALPLPLAKVICLLSRGGDHGLCYQPTSPPGRGDAMRGNARHPVCIPLPFPASLMSPAMSSLAKLMERLSFLFFSLVPLFLVLKKNHCDAKIMHLIRSQAPPVVTPFSQPAWPPPPQPHVASGPVLPPGPWLARLLPAEEAAAPEPHHPRGLHQHTPPPTCQAQTPSSVLPGPPPSFRVASATGMGRGGAKPRPDSDRRRREEICLKRCRALALPRGLPPPFWLKSHGGMGWGQRSEPRLDRSLSGLTSEAPKVTGTRGREARGAEQELP